MSIISNWVYAYKVCKKYHIKWNPFFGLSYAQYVFSYNMRSKTSSCSININPFYKNFLDTFFHEVGHCLITRKLFKESITHAEFDLKKANYFQEEFDAWKFAKRVMKKDFNKSWARNCFKTYFKVYAKDIGSIRAADRYYELDRKLSK